MKLLIFLIINFCALAIGGLSTSKGVPSDWYVNLNKAPWTPPGWVFGAAWSLIMVCFSIYMTHLWDHLENKKLIIVLFSFQFILNTLWSPVFFSYHFVNLGLIIISLLTLLILYLMVKYFGVLNLKSFYLLPYFIWLVIAISLNFYICTYN